MNIKTIEGDLRVENASFCLLIARFNSFIVDSLTSGAIDTLIRHGASPDKITKVYVPGAFEMPLALEKIAAQGKYDAIVALGAVIRGDTYHFEVVSNDACRAIMELQLHTGTPIANGILTCDTDEQAEVRMQPKGAECAQAAVEMANLQGALSNDD